MSARNSPLPALLVLVGIMILPGIDACAKLLTGKASIVTISLWRNGFQLLLLLPFALRAHGREIFRITNWRGNMLRSLCMTGSSLTFFASLQQLPIADALALSFIHPMIVALVAPWFLGEKLHPGQWAAIALGFIGALIIIRPGSGAFGMSAIYPVASAVFYAGYVLTTRQLITGMGSILLVQLWQAFFLLLFVVPIAAIGGGLLHIPAFMTAIPSQHSVMLLVALGAIATLGYWLITLGSRHVTAAITAGLGYSEIISSAAVGYLVFGDFPDRWTWVGVSVVIASGIWLLSHPTGERPATA